ncbi:MAG TPA: hypothetical protein VNG73_07345 [Gemmatimonadaceae bacterium]|nr:hypothetical protein [Gemmatimonadaceae bacterium]
MITETLIAGVVTALGEVAVDKATELVRRVGEEAWDALTGLYGFVTSRLTDKGGSTAVVVSEFRKDPVTYAKPLAKALNDACAEDPGFAEALTRLVQAYNTKVVRRGASEGIQPGGDLIAIGSVVGAGGSVYAGGDIVGGGKFGPT